LFFCFFIPPHSSVIHSHTIQTHPKYKIRTYGRGRKEEEEEAETEADTRQIATQVESNVQCPIVYTEPETKN
jgi:hypothetical protein